MLLPALLQYFPMKKCIYLSLIGLLFGLNLFGQPKEDLNRDRTWLFSRIYSRNPPKTLGYKFLFEENGLKVEEDSLIANVSFGNSNISDEFGDLLFYSNGCNIRDAQNNLLQGSENLNEGYINNAH